MSAGTVTVSSPGQPSHRVAALARAEGILLWRNRLALLNAVILPAALAGSLKSFGGLGASGARPDRNYCRRRSPPRPCRDLQRGRHLGARAHRLDRGGRVGCATLVPLGTAALGRRDTLER